MASNDPTLIKEAQICYICSGNLSKMIETSASDIHERVELILIMQKALEFQSTRPIETDATSAKVLSQYAEMLATEGDLQAALDCLGNSAEPRIVMLKERLSRALGYNIPQVLEKWNNKNLFAICFCNFFLNSTANSTASSSTRSKC